MQFLLSFLLTWAVVGTLAAMIMSSAGPVYYERIVGRDGGFEPLLTYLRAANDQFPVLALNVQETLWQNYQAGGAELGSGISAMPSMHVAMAYLFALVAWRTDHRLGYLFYAFAALIFLGSIHLAWHYALDSYVAMVLTWVIWKLVGLGLPRDQPATAS